jgi:phage/plasmid-associated DNA primase
MDLDFMRRLDSKPNLLAFTNGVYDLDAGLFRAASPEDWLSTSVGYDYCAKEDPDADAAWPCSFARIFAALGRRHGSASSQP